MPDKLIRATVAVVVLVGACSGGTDDFREMHRKAVASMREQNLSGEAAARSFVGKHVEVDCVVEQPMLGMFGGLGYAMRLDDQIWFVAGPHEDFDALKWVTIMKRDEGQRVHLTGVVGSTETPGSWSPLLIAVTKVTESQPSAVDRPSSATSTKISCHEWFEMSPSAQSEAGIAVCRLVQSEYEQAHSRKIAVGAGDFAALASAFTAICRAGAKPDPDLYTFAKLTSEAAFVGQ